MSSTRKGLTKLVAKKPARRLIVPTTPKNLKRATGGWLGVSLEKNYQDHRPEWGDERPLAKGWTPHSMGVACDREAVLAALGYRGEGFSSQLFRIFEMGHDVEARWLTRFQRLGVLVSSGTTVTRSEAPILRGKIDAKVNHPFEPGHILVVEIKSINLDGFRSLPKVSLDPEENFQSLLAMQGKIGQRIHQYLVQHQSYLEMDGSNEGLLLFECKDNQDYKDFYVVYEEAYVMDQYARLNRLNGNRERRTVPACSCVAPSKGIFCRHRPVEEVTLDEIRQLSEVRI